MRSMRSSARKIAPNSELELPAIVARCRADPEMLGRLRRIYLQANRAVAGTLAAADGPAVRCLGGGGCCKFDLFGHRLFLTVGELALLTSEPPTNLDAARRRRCPYQLGGRCTAYRRRPLGCRTFFCRDEKKIPLQRVHEHFHGLIRRLHQSRSIPYGYGELPGFIMQLFVDT